MLETIYIALVFVLAILVIILIEKNKKIKSLKVELENANRAIDYQEKWNDLVYNQNKDLERENQFLINAVNKKYGELASTRLGDYLK